MAKQSTQVINACDLKTLQPRVLTEFLWSELDLQSFGCISQGAGLKVVDLFRMVLQGDMAEVQQRFREPPHWVIDAVFKRLNEMKLAHKRAVCLRQTTQTHHEKGVQGAEHAALRQRV